MIETKKTSIYGRLVIFRMAKWRKNVNIFILEIKKNNQIAIDIGFLGIYREHTG